MLWFGHSPQTLKGRDVSLLKGGKRIIKIKFAFNTFCCSKLVILMIVMAKTTLIHLPMHTDEHRQ